MVNPVLSLLRTRKQPGCHPHNTLINSLLSGIKGQKWKIVPGTAGIFVVFAGPILPGGGPSNKKGPGELPGPF